MSLLTTITQLALFTPEIISEILGWINLTKIIVLHADHPGKQEILEPGRVRPLFRCARINRAWFRGPCLYSGKIYASSVDGDTGLLSLGAWSAVILLADNSTPTLSGELVWFQLRHPRLTV